MGIGEEGGGRAGGRGRAGGFGNAVKKDKRRVLGGFCLGFIFELNFNNFGFICKF